MTPSPIRSQSRIATIVAVCLRTSAPSPTPIPPASSEAPTTPRSGARVSRERCSVSPRPWNQSSASRSVAAALLGEPELLVLDEPANGLDPEGIRWLRNFLRSFAESGGTVFVSSHVLAEVAQVADDVVIIHRGKLVAQQSVTELTLQAAGATRVRSPRAEELLGRLRDAGIAAEATPDGGLAVQAAPELVGELAAEAGIPLHELVAEAGSLEEAFLELTAEPRQ